jgi:CheY-like chemotaxis protein
MARRVLVIEDEPENRLLLNMILTAEGYQVVETEDGPTGLRWAIEWRPDLILLDVMMPGMNGWAVFERLRADPGTRAIPVIMLTALAQRVDVERAVELGVEGYVTKPFEPAELVATMQSVLGAGGEQVGEG